ncbi:hypothetical protein ACLKA7_007450 [Drosophila subpalustris]
MQDAEGRRVRLPGHLESNISSNLSNGRRPAEMPGMVGQGWRAADCWPGFQLATKDKFKLLTTAFGKQNRPEQSSGPRGSWPSSA